MAALQKSIVLSTLATILGTRKDVGAVCTSDSINMWAKRKPFRDLMPSYASDAACDAARKAVDYGLAIPYFSSIPTMLSSAKNYGIRNLCWSYNKPRGVRSGYPSEWYRLLDFVGYSDERNYPFMDWLATPLAAYLIDPNPVVYDNSPVQPTPGADVPYLQKSDFTKLSAMPYVGFAFRVKGSSTVYAFTTNTRTDIPFTTKGVTYECCFFYSKVSITYGSGSLPQGTDYFALLPLPYLEMSINSEFGVAFNGTDAGVFGTQASFVPNYNNLGTARQIHHVRFCVRNVAHWTYNSSAQFGKQYTITKHKDADLSYKEADYDNWYDGENESTDTVLNLAVCGTAEYKPLSTSSSYQTWITMQNVDPYLSPNTHKWFITFSVGGENYVLDITSYIRWPIQPIL